MDLTVDDVARLVKVLTPEQRARVVHVDDGYDIYIGDAVPSRGFIRASGWYNPFHCTSQDKKDPAKMRASVRKYTEYLLKRMRDGVLSQDALESTLGGQRLGCWCRKRGTDTVCHGLVLVALCDRYTEAWF